MYKKILMLLLAAVIAFSAIPAKDGHAGTTHATRYESSSADYEYISELISYGDAITANQNDDYAYMWLSEVLVFNSKYPMSSVNASITSLCSTILYYDSITVGENKNKIVSYLRILKGEMENGFTVPITDVTLVDSTESINISDYVITDEIYVETDDVTWVDKIEAPTLSVKKVPSRRRAVITFSDSDDAKYEIQVSTKKSFKKKATKTFDTARDTVTVSNLARDVKYYVRVRAYKVVDGIYVYSDWSKTHKIKF